MAFPQMNQTRPIPGAVATQGVDVRRDFIRKTYAHLAAAVLGFVAMSFLLYDSGFSLKMTRWVFLNGRFAWLGVLIAFVLVGKLADSWSRSDNSRGMQYVGLAVYVVAEAFIFAPLLYVAAAYSDPSVIPNAATLTLALFAGLTGTVLLTKKDFSFLRGAIVIGSMIAMGIVVGSLLFGFQLGMIFAAAMIALAGGAILYQTSQIMAHYRPTQHVSAALGLFASVALMFYYALWFFMSMNRR